MNAHRNSVALYVHWPFCLSKCPYCDFNSYVFKDADFGQWQEAYISEIRYYASLTSGRRLTSIYFGGGTPSLMPAGMVAEIITEAGKHWGFDKNLEITIEANPTSAEIGKFRGFRNAGVNRLSIGIQSLKDEDLRFLGRRHSAAEAVEALGMAAEVFDRFSFDLIYARPSQTVDVWSEELSQALRLAGGHISLYQLTIEPGTTFHNRYVRGEFTLPDEETAARMFEVTTMIAGGSGLFAYEVSNYASPGNESIHNLNCWRYQDYIGIGPGAHGRLTVDGNKVATCGARAPGAWLGTALSGNYGADGYLVVSPKERAAEAVLMGLRLAEGLPLKRIEEEAGCPWQKILSAEKINYLEREGFLEKSDNAIKATASGMTMLDEIIRMILL